jgi:hypothetical protein
MAAIVALRSGAVPTPVPRPPWLKVAAPLALAGIVAWPVLAMLGLLGAIPPQAVVNVGIVTAVLAYISIRRIKRDRAIAMGETDPGDGSASS